MAPAFRESVSDVQTGAARETQVIAMRLYSPERGYGEAPELAKKLVNDVAAPPISVAAFQTDLGPAYRVRDLRRRPKQMFRHSRSRRPGRVGPSIGTSVDHRPTVTLALCATKRENRPNAWGGHAGTVLPWMPPPIAGAFHAAKGFHDCSGTLLPQPGPNAAVNPGAERLTTGAASLMRQRYVFATTAYTQDCSG